MIKKWINKIPKEAFYFIEGILSYKVLKLQYTKYKLEYALLELTISYVRIKNDVFAKLAILEMPF